MKEVSSIYHNDFGVSFYWKKGDKINFKKIQIIFKETGFYLSLEQLQLFKSIIDDTLNKVHTCKDCKNKKTCDRLLLRTPLHQIDLAVSIYELNYIKDLVEGSVFRIEMQQYINGYGRN